MLRSLRDGDVSAFDEVYLMCVGPVQNFLQFLLHSTHDAEELSQDIFTKLWENRANIDPKQNFKGYLYLMTKSAAFNHLARRKVEEKYRNFKLTSLPDFELAPDEFVESKEMMLLIDLLLDGMPAQRSKVFRMSKYEGKSNEEIAKELGLSTHTVRSHIQNATNNLKKFISIVALFF